MRKLQYNHLTQITKWRMMNAYLVEEEDGVTVVDTLMKGSGTGIIAAAARTGKQITRIVLTHAHVDHAGSLEEMVAKLPEVEIIISEREAPIMAGDREPVEGEPQDAKLRGGYPVVKVTPTRTVNEGDTIGSLIVYAAPGHTPGQIALMDNRDGTLIVGDAFSTLFGVTVAGKVNFMFPLPAFATWHKPTSLETARKLYDLAPARLASGHGPVVESPVEEMGKAVAAAEKAFS